MNGDFAINRLITKPYPAAEPDLVFYIRPGGLDTNNGLTPATAFKTLERAIREQDLYSVNRSVIIDATGMTGADTLNGDYLLQLGGTNLGGIRFGFDLAATSPDNFFSRCHRQIRSELAHLVDLDVTGQSFDATSGILQLTVSDALVANALRGQFAVGSVLGEYGVIQGNTGGAGPNTVEVANIVGLTGPIAVYEPGATIRFGDAADPFDGAIYLLALCDWNLQGLFIESNGPKAASISVWPHAPVYFTLCDIQGIELNEGAGVVTIDGCYVHGQSFIQDGATVTTQQSYFREVDFLCHGSGASGLNELVGCIFEANLSAYGGGNVESRFTFQMDNCRIVGHANEGVMALFGVSRIQDTTIDDCGKAATIAQNQVTLYLTNVQGAGNGGYGCQASYGAIVRNAGGTAVTGLTNDVLVGNATPGGTTWPVAPAYVTDLDQLVRVGP